MVALNGARQKGVTAAALEFATTNYHALGVNALFYYNFNETNNQSTILDSSGNNINATVSGGCNLSNSYCRLSDSPGNGGFSFTTINGTQSASALLPTNLPPVSQFSVSVWVKPTNFNTQYQEIISVPTTVGNGRLIYVDLRNDNGYYAHIDYPSNGYTCGADTVGGMQAGQWQNITFSFNGSSYTAYINGKSIALQSPASGCIPGSPSGTIYIGGGGGPGNSFNGSIDDLAVYTQSLSINEVQHLYALGAAKHGIALK